MVEKTYNVGNIKNIESLKIACKYIDRNVNKAIVVSNNSITSITESAVIDFVIYLYNLLYLEYNYLKTIEIDDSIITTPNNTEYVEVEKGIKLFPQNVPKLEEVKQGDVGDCYLLSALSSLAQNNPQAIKKCFLNADSFEQDGYIQVRLYKIKINFKKLLRL